MAKEFIYIFAKTGKVLFRSIEPNYASKELVDQKVRQKTGVDPRLERGTVECTIRVVGEPDKKSIGRYDKNKRMS